MRKEKYSFDELLKSQNGKPRIPLKPTKPGKKRTIEDAFFISDNYEEDHDLNYAYMVYILGLENVVEHIPFSREEIIQALLNGDRFLKSLDLDFWTLATGINVSEDRPPEIFNDWFFELISRYDPTIEVVSPAQIICTLKIAAKMWVQDEMDWRIMTGVKNTDSTV